MYDKISIEKNLDPLTKERWEFLLFETDIVLDRYELGHRENTRKRSWGIVKLYSRLTHGINRYGNNLIGEEDVPLTEEIKKEVLEKFISKLKVIRWGERKR